VDITILISIISNTWFIFREPKRNF